MSYKFESPSLASLSIGASVVGLIFRIGNENRTVGFITLFLIFRDNNWAQTKKVAQKNQLQIEVHQEISNMVVDVLVLEVRVVVVKLVVDAVVMEEMDAVAVENVDVLPQISWLGQEKQCS